VACLAVCFIVDLQQWSLDHLGAVLDGMARAGNPRTDWLYNTEPDPGLNGRALRYPRGKTLGAPTLNVAAPICGRKPGAQYNSDQELARLAGDIATTIFHPAGTTRMGADGDPMAVLDGRLRLRGVENLRVVDAGAMPTITRGNTNSPTLMMPEKAAAWINPGGASRFVPAIQPEQ
jgi:choline dehydrogenase-like flavoprotein